jgi:hypothetical protein
MASAKVRPKSTRAMGHRQCPEAIHDALAHVLGQADGARRSGEGHGLAEDAGHQVVAVGVRRLCGSAPSPGIGMAPPKT